MLRTIQAYDNLDNLPAEVYPFLFEKLDKADVAVLKQVSRRLRKIVDDYPKKWWPNISFPIVNYSLPLATRTVSFKLDSAISDVDQVLLLNQHQLLLGAKAAYAPSLIWYRLDNSGNAIYERKDDVLSLDGLIKLTDDSFLLIKKDGEVAHWNANGESQVLVQAASGATKLISATPHHFMTFNDITGMHLWKIDRDPFKVTLLASLGFNITRHFRDIKILPNGKIIVGFLTRLEIWDSATIGAPKVINFGGLNTLLAFDISTEGNIVVVHSRNSINFYDPTGYIRTYDMESGACVKTIRRKLEDNIGLKLYMRGDFLISTRLRTSTAPRVHYIHDLVTGKCTEHVGIEVLDLSQEGKILTYNHRSHHVSINAFKALRTPVPVTDNLYFLQYQRQQQWGYYLMSFLLRNLIEVVNVEVEAQQLPPSIFVAKVRPRQPKKVVLEENEVTGKKTVLMDKHQFERYTWKKAGFTMFSYIALARDAVIASKKASVNLRKRLLAG